MMKTCEEMIQSVLKRKKEYEKKQERRQRLLIGTFSAVTCLALVIAAGLMIKPVKEPELVAEEENYRVLIDVNPSLELVADERDVVVKATALNGDGERILEKESAENKPLEEAVKGMCEAMVDLEYISEEANSVLVSFEGLEENKSRAVRESLAESISRSLADRKVEGAIILQTVPENSRLCALATQYEISVGKAQLIAQIIQQNKLLTYEELSSLTIHELNLLKASYYIEMEDAKEVGSPVEMAYIGQEKATQIALNDARVQTEQTETRLECLSSAMVYLVEFETETKEYRYYINAVTGEIVSAEAKEIGKDRFHESETDDGFIGEAAALAAARAHAGMENTTLIRCKFNRDWVDGNSVYNLYFTDGLATGRYVIHARTGEILQHSKIQEPRDRSVKEIVIGEERVRGLVLSKNGLIDGNVSKYEINLRAEKDLFVYDIMMIHSGTRYTASVNALTGDFIGEEKEILKDTGAPSVEKEAHISQE